MDLFPGTSLRSFMVVRGRVKNGLVVPDIGIQLPEGAEVSISVPPLSVSEMPPVVGEKRTRLRALLDRIDAIPDENPGDAFSGADHDRVLYGAD